MSSLEIEKDRFPGHLEGITVSFQNKGKHYCPEHTDNISLGRKGKYIVNLKRFGFSKIGVLFL